MGWRKARRIGDVGHAGMMEVEVDNGRDGTEGEGERMRERTRENKREKKRGELDDGGTGGHDKVEGGAGVDIQKRVGRRGRGVRAVSRGRFGSVRGVCVGVRAGGGRGGGERSKAG